MQTETYTLDEIRSGLRRVKKKLLDGSISAAEFDMNVPMISRWVVGADKAYHPCGTKGCIGGWLAVELGVDPTGNILEAMNAFTKVDPELHYMFYGFGNFKIERKAGANAITRYLEGKEAWH
jgi:hypothetical protein